MMRRPLLILAGFLMVLTGALFVPTPQASAASGCADVEVIFARGTAETAPPVGVTGESLVAALRNELPGKSVAVHGVNYPAGSNFNDRVAFVEGVVQGVTDTQRRIEYLAANCPRTHIVVGGYSQGGAVATYALGNKIMLEPKYQQYENRVPAALNPDVARHVTAVLLFAPPSQQWVRQIGAPPMAVSSLYTAKTKTYCIAGDVVCDGAPVGQPNSLHVLYAVNGMTVDAARHVTARI